MIIMIMLVYQIMINSLGKINRHQGNIQIKKIMMKKLIELFKVLEGLVMLIKVIYSQKILFNWHSLHLLLKKKENYKNLC